MSMISKNTLAAAFVVLTLGAGVAAISTPASAHGGGGPFGGFGLFHSFAGGFANSADDSSGTLYDASGTPARGVKCRTEKQKLYDDDDNVVGSRLVQVCPITQQ